jgi:hypothetical protein
MTEGLERRQVDVRLAIVEQDIKRVLDTVTEIDKALRFPENSALGRNLIDRAERNAKNIESNTSRIEALEDRVTELDGVAKALRIAALLLGLAIAVYTLAQVVG